ncbi:hypothetical protein FUAX_28030 [Fulvitalea axinellae]|uniref:DoxX family membrane protein n=2 Tax=Fulvitalea axinellae TaxID=1182444 RepID=A0AAU9CE16_9BACT|nr:hypothetical protein FUAX_28030 [Fulvitalea axinellae]
MEGMKNPLYVIAKMGLGLIFLIPGIFKLIQPAAFLEYLTMSPVQIPFGHLMFYPVTVFEILAGLLLVLPGSVLFAWRRYAYLALSGILVVALATVVIPDASNMFADQIEMAELYTAVHPDRAGLNIDVFPSKIGLINILFHVYGIAILLALFVYEHKLAKSRR